MMPEPQDPIRLLRETPVDVRRLAQVRGRVLARLERSRPWTGRWVLAGAGAFAFSFAALWLTRTEERRLPALVWSAPAPPEWALYPVPIRAAQPPAPEPQRRRAPTAPRVLSTENETALLEIPTSNPDVVLYWLVDSGGD